MPKDPTDPHRYPYDNDHHFCARPSKQVVPIQESSRPDSFRSSPIFNPLHHNDCHLINPVQSKLDKQMPRPNPVQRRFPSSRAGPPRQDRSLQQQQSAGHLKHQSDSLTNNPDHSVNPENSTKKAKDYLQDLFPLSNHPDRHSHHPMEQKGCV